MNKKTTMKKNTINLILCSAALTLCLSACQASNQSSNKSSNAASSNTIQTSSAQTNNTISVTGLAYEQTPLSNAQVTLRDSAGKKFTAETNSQGAYNIQASNLSYPLLISVVAQGKAEDCAINSRLRPICLAGIISKAPSGKSLVANINPLTDRIVSDIAVTKGFIGPQQWIDSDTIGTVDEAAVDQALSTMRQGFSEALKAVGVKKPKNFDPVTFPMADTSLVTEIFSLLHHNRNYENNTGQTGHASLTDFGFRPIVGLAPAGAYERFDLERARKEFQQVKNAKTRIFIVGDSTSAVYEKLRFPRMGWGQAFEAQFKPDGEIQVIVGSRAGRSSRDFYNGRWFAQMEPLIQAGDYVFINHGHNDQNCDSSKPLRGAADVKNLCTYPNNSEGQPQFPNNTPELSFQHSLERYIKIARERGAKPVLFTPTARIKNAQGQQATPVAHSHFTKQNASHGYLFAGDYTQTIKDTATANAVPLIDLEAASIQFANGLGTDSWKNYWLVVDPAINSFYANGVAGSTQAPDGTHFQQKGAEAMAGLVAREIKTTAELKELSAHLQ